MEKSDLVIRIGGEAGEGVQSTGQLLTQAAARAGYTLLTYYSPPAEIKGGHALYQLRVSNHPLYAQGDTVDILMAFNREAYDLGHGELRDGGLLIYDSSVYTPPAEGNRKTLPLPLTEIAKGRLRFELGKNVVAVGAMAALFGMPTDPIRKLLHEKFARKGEDVLNKNYAALDAGIAHVKEHFPQRAEYELTAGVFDPETIIVSGNQALGMGAIAAGCRYMYGYPITPATEILEFMATELPRLGGCVVQAEDEIASMNMVIGASYGGAKAMTSTSGPGVSLMVEALGLAAISETPCVLVDVQRSGPSTGMPTKQEQGDLNLAVYGGHGDFRRIVVAPVSVADCFYQIVTAFNLAEKYQVPVVFLSDTSLATRIETIRRPDLSQLKIITRKTFQPDGNGHGHNGSGNGKAELNGHGYRRFEATEDYISPIAIPGTPGGGYVATGLEHTVAGVPTSSPINHWKMTEKRFRKLDRAEEDYPEAWRHGDPTAEIGIVTWGSTAGAVAEAVDLAAARGIKVDAIAPKVLWPMADKQLRPFIESKRVILVPEVNYSGQFAAMLRGHFLRDVKQVNICGGLPFRAGEILQAIEEVLVHA